MDLINLAINSRGNLRDLFEIQRDLAGRCHYFWNGM
jgi:hypothetical protein